MSLRWVLETAPAKGENFNTNSAVEDTREFEGDWDTSIGFSWTSVIGDRSSNSFQFTRIGEQLSGGAQAFFDENVNFVGYPNNDQFGTGSFNEHSGFDAGPGGEATDTHVRTYIFQDTYSYFIPTDNGGDHNLKIGAGYSQNKIPNRIRSDTGLFKFETDFPYMCAGSNDPSCRVADTFPTEFEIALNPPNTPGFDVGYEDDWRMHLFVADKWRLDDNVTLNLGVRYDRQNAVPKPNAISPRVGFAWDPSGEGKTVVRGGLGKFALWSRVAINVDLVQRQLVTQNPTFATDNPASAVLNPDLVTDGQGRPGVAELSDAGVAELEVARAALLSGNRYSTEPRFDDPDRSMQYQWGWSLGVQRELAQDVALTVDYVANITRNQVGRIDINEPVNGVRPGVDVFDPDGELVPFDLAGARDTNFRRIYQYQTPSEMNGDYKSLQIGIRKRFANRHGYRVAYTLQKTNRVGSDDVEATVWNDNDIRADYGRGTNDRRHVFVVGGNFNPVGGLNIGVILSIQSAAPINEVTGRDDNQDKENDNDRPIPGVTDAGVPIVSDIGALGAAEIWGIDGENYIGGDISIRYNFDLGGNKTLGLFWDMFNLANRNNLNNPTGNRTSGNFLIPTSAGLPRQMQLGVRFMF